MRALTMTKPWAGLVASDIKPANVDRVTLHVRRSEDPERSERLLDILRAMVAEHRGRR